MHLVGDGALALDDPVPTVFTEWRGADREEVTVRRSARALVGPAAPAGRCAADRPPRIRARICPMPLEYAPGTRSIYSDLGFILLGFCRRIAAARARRRSFDSIADASSARRSDVRAVDVRSARGRADEPLPMRTSDAGRVSSAKCTTTTLRRLAASPDMPGCSEPPRRSAPSRGRAERARAAMRRPVRRSRRSSSRRVHDASRRARQFARARLGHDAADLVMRHADVAVRVRPRRLHRHVALDRSGPGSLLRAADQSRARRRIARRDARRPTRVSRRAGEDHSQIAVVVVLTRRELSVRVRPPVERERRAAARICPPGPPGPRAAPAPVPGTAGREWPPCPETAVG